MPHETPMIVRYAATKKLVYLSRYLAQQERLDLMELEMQVAAMQALIAALDKVQLHQISLSQRVVWESLRAPMFRQYLCSPATTDSAHIIHKVQT